MGDAAADKRLGVIWHTTGSGKSLSMTFLVGVLRRRLHNPAFVIQVDRTDLDDQLHDQFTVARALTGPVSHAESVDPPDRWWRGRQDAAPVGYQDASAGRAAAGRS